MNKQCPNCGSFMKLDVSTNKWICTNFECNFIEDNNISTNNEAIGTYSLYHCNNCNYSFYGSNINNCFICGNRLDRESCEIEYDKYIEFNINREDAVNKYKRILLSKIFCPFSFRKKKNYMRITGVYIPIDIFDVTLDGEVIFNCSDIDNKTKKLNNFKSTCKGHFDYNDVLINKSVKFNNSLLEYIEPFDISNMTDFSNLNINDNIIYKEDCDDNNIYSRLKNRCSNNALKMMSDLVNHNKSKVSEDKLEFKYNKKNSLLVPVYILYNYYKGKEYKFVMNGESGNTYIETPISTFLVILFSLILFSLLFLIGFLICVLV